MSGRLIRLATICLLLFLYAAVAFAETDYRGRAGISYDIFDFRGGVPVSSQNVDSGSSPVLRQLFRHSISFDATGTLGPERYGHWAMGIALDGYYDRATWRSGSNVDNYYSPDLRNLRGSLSLIPSSRIPTSLYYTGQHNYAINYDEQNKYVVTTERPILAVLRKYDTRRRDFGGFSSFLARPDLKFRVAYEGSKQQVSRIYDFGEDRDFVSIIQGQGSGTLPEYPVVFTNSLPESLTVYMDDTLLFAGLEPAGQRLVQIPTGIHRFDLRAPSYNTFTVTRDINGITNWVVRYNPPSTPNDRDVVANAGHLQGLYEPGSEFRNETRLDLESSEDGVLQTKGSSTAFNNNLTYRPGDKTLIQGLTNYHALTSQNAGLPEETQASLNHYTVLDYDVDRNTTMLVSHNYSTLSDRGLRSHLNAVEASGSKQFNRRYSTDLRLTGGKLTDNRGFSRDNIGVRSRHRFQGIDLRVAKTTLSGEFDFKASTEHNPGRFQTEYDDRILVDNDFGRWGRFGNVTGSFEFATRWFADQSGDLSETKTTWNVTVSNNEWSRLKLFAFMHGEDSKTSGTGSQAGIKFSSLTGKLSALLNLGNGATGGGSVMFATQSEVDIVRYHVNFQWIWPVVPVRHALNYQEERKDYGSDLEVFKTFGQRATLRLRSIDLVVEHNLIFERVRLGASRYQDFRFKLERGFNI